MNFTYHPHRPHHQVFPGRLSIPVPPACATCCCIHTKWGGRLDVAVSAVAITTPTYNLTCTLQQTRSSCTPKLSFPSASYINAGITTRDLIVSYYPLQFRSIVRDRRLDRSGDYVQARGSQSRPGARWLCSLVIRSQRRGALRAPHRIPAHHRSGP